MKKKSVRLSKNIVPIEYDIQLKPDLENFTFSGIETITLDILQKTKIITLHSKEIEIDTVDILIGKEKVFGKISYDKKSETTTFTFPKIISAGKTRLNLVFKGILNDKMRGFYRSCYNIDGKECVMATTQFEATDARRAFPCFDEPAQKAVFRVSLVVPKGKTAISNTLPVSVREHESGYDIVEFSPTPRMSTYLLAFIVGDFECIEASTPSPLALPLRRGRGTRVRIFTTPGKKHQAKFALDCAVKILEFYEKYFDIKYPLPALDLIAIPDFSSGAMENWGAVTYRESALLVDEEHSSASNKQWVALVIAHELAHQWFGNLVTMEWWTHLWLNEGFASYIEYLAVDKLFPSWDIWTQFSTDDTGRALRLDALASTHPIEVEVHHPDEIGEIFDEVSYSKGASLIRMLAEYLGEKNFRDGLRHYLKKHSYQNTSTVHLWRAFEKVSGQPIAKMMKNWTGKPGYPVVKARIIKNKLSLSQERFFANPISKKKARDKTRWQIPFNIKNNKVNFGEAGFYRTAYSKELLEKLRKPIQNKELGARDRLGTIRDLFALSEAGTIPTTDALEFLGTYKHENNYTVWLEIASGLARLEQITARTPLAENLDKFILKFFSPLAKKLSWTKKAGEHHTDALLRSLAIARAGHAGDKKIIAEARKKFAQMKSGTHVSPDLRGAIYSIVATWGGPKEYNALLKLYKKETLHEEKNRIGGALGDFKNKKLLACACAFAMSSDVRPQDSVGILSGVGANPLGRNIWWDFVKKNWQTLVTRYGEGGLTLGRAMKAISGSAEPKHLKDFKKFFRAHPAPGAKRAIAQVLERLESNIIWFRRDYKLIKKFLSKYENSKQ
ncbi:M1 family metallopeptidase [Candidatus Nomurabacteria bacterium]|nr:M1 family metallopeptidase [Candidatus Nomurabacteria bacterium]